MMATSGEKSFFKETILSSFFLSESTRRKEQEVILSKNIFGVTNSKPEFYWLFEVTDYNQSGRLKALLALKIFV